MNEKWIFWEHAESFEPSNDICSNCGKLLDSEGMCWNCITNTPKKSEVKKKLSYGVYNDINNKKPKKVK